MKTSLVCPSSKICWEMIFNVYDLSHIFNSVANSLIVSLISCIVWSEVLNALCHLLILRCRAFNCVEVELVFVWTTAYTSFIYNTLINWFFHIYILRIIIHYLSRVSKLIKFTIINGLWLWTFSCSTWRKNLRVVSTSLWSSFYLVLYLLSLFLVRITNLNALTDLLVMWSI